MNTASEAAMMSTKLAILALLSASLLTLVNSQSCSAVQACCNDGFCQLSNPRRRPRVSCCQCQPGTSSSGCCGSAPCASCEAGMFSTQLGAATCTECAPGSFNPNVRQTACQLCPPGQFNPERKQIACRPCLGGHYSNSSGALTCDDCPAGSYCLSGSSSPIPCPPGQFNPERKQIACRPCLGGHYSNSSGALTCDDCPAGSYCLSGSSSPIPCPPGSECKINSSEPQPCAAGTYSASSGSPQCDECPVRAFCPFSGLSFFLPCTAGSFCPRAGMAVPIVCPAGSSCPGNSSTPFPCPPTTFCPHSNMTDPLPCPSGQFCPNSGSSAGTPCSRGFYCPPGLAVECRCRVLTFADETGQSSCKPCEYQAVPNTGQSAFVTIFAQHNVEKGMYLAMLIIFASISFSSTCLFIVLFRSRPTFVSRPFHSGVCVYIGSIVLYSCLKALAVNEMLGAQTRQVRKTAEILLKCTFMVFFWLGFVGKMVIIQLWIHVMDGHFNSGGNVDGAGSNEHLIGMAHRTWKVLRVAVVFVCVSYSIGFAVFLDRYFRATALCESQIDTAESSDMCILDNDSGQPSGCISLSNTVQDIQYYWTMRVFSHWLLHSRLPCIR
jgi:hypothetical protein